MDGGRTYWSASHGFRRARSPGIVARVGTLAELTLCISVGLALFHPCSQEYIKYDAVTEVIMVNMSQNVRNHGRPMMK